MPRSLAFVHPQRPPVTVRPAATVLLMRDTPTGLEVLMTRRSMTASFAPGAYVFPGGGIDAADAAAHAHADRRATQGEVALTQTIAAIRESFEELGVLLARHVDGRALVDDDLAGLDRNAALAPQLAQRGWRMAADGVYQLAHWITDRDIPRRFDVPFLVARMPEGQTPVADEREQFEPVWVRPADALARHEAGQFFLIYPTIRTLERLTAYPSVDELFAACGPNRDGLERPLWISCPRAGWLNGREARFMEHEMAFGELALTSPDGQMVHTLDWQSERPVRLLQHVQRLTAPNPGRMTGPGTNSYLVGTPNTGFIAIDPGPADAGHVQRLFDAAGGDICAIVCTHSHPDHSPGAPLLQALCADASKGKPLILGLPSAPTARAGCEFTPDRSLQNGEHLVVDGPGLSADLSERYTLRVIHTPGHAANHLCLVLLEDGLLFSGDHILNGSTTVVDPPDGHMGDYLRSLDLLSAACDEHGIDFILPAHGWVLGDWHDAETAGGVSGAKRAIAHLKAHRLKREAKVLAAMRQLPGGDVDDWLPLAYDDTPRALWPVARRSLLAHLERIRDEQLL